MLSLAVDRSDTLVVSTYVPVIGWYTLPQLPACTLYAALDGFNMPEVALLIGSDLNCVLDPSLDSFRVSRFRDRGCFELNAPIPRFGLNHRWRTIHSRKLLFTNEPSLNATRIAD